MKKAITVILLIAFALSALSSCGLKSEKSAAPSAVGQKMTAPDSEVKETPAEDVVLKGAGQEETARETVSGHVIGLSQNSTATPEYVTVSDKVVPVLDVPENESIAVEVDPFLGEAFITAVDEMDAVTSLRRVAATSGADVYMIAVDPAFDPDTVSDSLLGVTGVTDIADPASVTIPERDLAAEYTGELKDEDGNLLVPFDVVYQDMMDDESVVYCDDHILVKTLPGFDGEVTREMKLSGIKSLRRFMETEGGDWYRAFVTDASSVGSILRKVRSLTTVTCAEYDYSYEVERIDGAVILGDDDVADPSETDPQDTDPVEPDPVDTDPVEPGPVDTDPVDTDPIDTDPIDTDPIDTDPIDTDPVDTDPVDTDPVDTDPIDTDPIDTDPVDTDPIDTDPVDTDPIETDPVDTDPVEPNEPEELIDEVTGNPMAEDQWYLKACDIQPAWNFLKEHDIPAGGASDVIVAVIDTGVDYNHPDLISSMWTNMGEIPGNGIDDDNNGYVDDVHGADMIANSGDPMDDHGHGTHVAGIIGAANNKEGIVGVAYNTKIMAVKAGQQTGIFNQSDIAEAIIYAWQNGADVINMSFGGAGLSIATEDALIAAYTRCVLVAAAGNNGIPNEPTPRYTQNWAPSYPGALSYVVGVMSVSEYGVESGFTNWDYITQNYVEYETYAPGERILSTFPGGRYVYLNGTSMASPIVAGIAALLRSYYTDRDMYPSRYIAAQLSATSEERPYCLMSHDPHNVPMIVNAYDGLTKLPKPEIHLYDYYLNDNDDGYVDAGDTLELGFVLRNRWGMSRDTVVTLDTRSWLGYDTNDGTPINGPENQYVEIVNGTADLGSVGTYNTRSMLLRNENQEIVGIEDPLILKISKDCPNDYYITIRVHMTYGNGLDEEDLNEYGTGGPDEYGESFTFTVRNGVIKKGQITEDEVWTKDNIYIIPENLFIAEGATVTVEAGTRIQFYSSITEEAYGEIRPAMMTVAGKFITNGTEDEPVSIFPSDLLDRYAVQIQTKTNGLIYLDYTKIINPIVDATEVDHCYFDLNYRGKLTYYYTSGGYFADWADPTISANSIRNTVIKHFGGINSVSGLFENCMIYNDMYYNGGWGQKFFNKCVFTGPGNYTIDSTCYEYKWSGPGTGYYPMKIFETEESEYWTVNPLYVTDLSRYFFAEGFSRFLGGHLACFETEEELINVISNYPGDWTQTYAIGHMWGSTEWFNGTPVGDWIDSYTLEVNGKYGFLSMGKESEGGICYGAPQEDGFIMELPKIIGDSLTPEVILAKYVEFYNGNFCSFTGNAVLNNFRVSDPNAWFRIKTPVGNIKSSVAGNWWGTTNEDLINKILVDFDYNASYMDLDPYPYLTEPPEDVWPFVTDAYLEDVNGERVYTVGNETVTFVVEFNRDMDTEYGLRVRFGAAEPYAEYEIDGSFVTPRRWEGVYTLRTTIENGTQFFRIEDGRAADDHWMVLCETPARFAFEIDTSGAMSMMMQANPTAEGIELTWLQDDYETLAGYNVYRSNKEDGLYTRLNNTVIPVGEEYFFDDTVEPGELYYYNFTVVLSDMTETTPSGKVMARAYDTMAPNLYHTPVRTAFMGTSLVISATATDNLALRSVILYYRTTGTETWSTKAMDPFNDKYSAVIPADRITQDGLEYYIEASDGINVTRRGTSETPYQVTVKTAVDANSKGDVDGDGVITNRDALMIIQAVNDLLNLTEEQFLRADLNGDGELSGAEALRILKYVSGKITTVVG